MNVNVKEKTYKHQTPSQDHNYILEIQNLKKYFPIKAGILQRTVGHVKAVDGISFGVKKGETLGIVGESGCGKSTAGRTIIRLERPTEGKVFYKGKDISHIRESELRKVVRKEIQMIFQDPYASLNPRKTLGSTLMEPLKEHKILNNHNERLDRVKELLETVGLDSSFTNRYPHEFSGGQRQRIGIARTLALNPELIIADEAVSALDVSIQAQVINLMQKLQEEFQLTYLFISHDLSVVRHISDRVAVMYLGKIMEIAEKHRLYAEPMHPYTQSLLSAVPEPLRKGVKRRERIILKGDIPNPANPPKGCVFSTRCPAVMDICREVSPNLKAENSDHYVACHLYN